MEVNWVEIDALTPNPKNPNVHSPEQIERLVKLIKEYGWRHPIIVSNQSKMIVVGHGRLEAAKKIGLNKVPVTYQDFESPDIEYGFMVADNAIADWADLDFKAINAHIPELGPDFDLDLLGISNLFLDPSEKYENIKNEKSEDRLVFLRCPHCEERFEKKQAEIVE